MAGSGVGQSAGAAVEDQVAGGGHAVQMVAAQEGVELVQGGGGVGAAARHDVAQGGGELGQDGRFGQSVAGDVADAQADVIASTS